MSKGSRRSTSLFLLVKPGIGAHRLWDTYLSESGGGGRAFADFHVYVCAAFLRIWSKQLQAQRDFQVR